MGRVEASEERTYLTNLRLAPVGLNKTKTVKQFTKEEATEIAKTKKYEDWDDLKKVETSLNQQRLLMPFDILLDALARVFKRPVSNAELGNKKKLKEGFKKLKQ